MRFNFVKKGGSNGEKGDPDVEFLWEDQTKKDKMAYNVLQNTTQQTKIEQQESHWKPGGGEHFLLH